MTETDIELGVVLLRLRSGVLLLALTLLVSISPMS